MMSRGFFALFVFIACFANAVELGDSKTDVLDALGTPRSTMAVGNQEFLTFATGKIVLTDGKVSAMRGDFSATAANDSPAASPPPSAPARPNPTTSLPRRVNWLTNFAAAKRAADAADKRILALFTGTDWCPPCQQFEAQVAHDEQFAGIFAGDFVFLKVNWLRNTPQPPAVAAEVNRLRNEYDISQYPTLKILDASGEELDTVDWTSVRGGTLKEAMIEAIDDSRKATKGGKKAASSWWPF
jgi:thiol-disulfide isomerase/thioredoxin